MSSSTKRRQTGFTIVEMLIVIVVIGILGYLVCLTYSGVQAKTRNNERTSDLKQLQSGLETYFSENGRYPATTDLGPNSANNVTFLQANLKGCSNAGCNKEILRDPKAAVGIYSLGSSATAVFGQYQYKPTDDAGNACDNTTTDCTKYVLTAKAEGTNIDIIYDSLN